MLVGFANQYNFGILVTLHTNPREKKPRGHLGSELWRKCDSVFLLTRADGNPDIRVLTTSFEFGKNRSDTDKLDTYFTWSDEPEQRYFIGLPDYTPQEGGNKRTVDYRAKFESVYDRHGPMNRGTLKEALVRIHETATRTADRWILKAIDDKIIIESGGYYALNDLPF